MALGEHHVQRFELGRSLRPTSVFRRGYDFRMPALALEAEAKLSDLGGGEPARGDVYEHHEEDEEPNVRQQAVTAELEQHRANVEVARGESGCRRLVPGARFKLCDHDVGRLDREYVVTDIKHTGWDPQAATQGQAVYVNTFESVPATVAARPRRPARALQQVTETALVVGPEGQEIYTDEYGRVKVQFHWDREGRRDERSSCWIRVSQAWAGSGWGFEFIPRVGMEVVVTFLGGDVDRPLITGCVPNAINKPPFKLPEDKTRSGIRTHSTPGGHGYNELSFEDRKGAELVHLRAERNLDEKVVHDQITVVGHNKTLAVGASLDEKIELDHATTVVGNRRETILGTAGFSCAGGRSTSTAKNDVRQVGGNDIAIVAGDVVRQVMGNITDSVRQNVTVSVNGHHDLHIGTHELLKHGSVFASGNYRIIAGREAVVLAERSITFTCGESEITLSPEGITLKGKVITLEGGAISAKGSGAEVRVGDTAEIISDKIHLQAKEAAIDLELEAKIDGNLVKLNCGPERVKVGPNGEEVPNHAVLQVVQHMAGEPFDRMKVTVANARGETREYICLLRRICGPEGALAGGRACEIARSRAC
jgi:type VI secretion system secreted protein VgrG